MLPALFALPTLGEAALPILTGIGAFVQNMGQTGDPLKALSTGGLSAAGTLGLGRVFGAGSRMAGNALAQNYSKVPQALVPLTQLASKIPQSAVVGAGQMLGQNLVPQIAAALPTPSLSGLATAGGVGQRVLQGSPSGNVNVPVAPSLTGQYGPRTYTDVTALNSFERGQVARGIMEAEGQLAQMKKLMPYEFDMIQKGAQADLYRQAAGAQLRTQLAQGAQAMNQAQLGAQALAQQGNQAVLNAATTRGGYV
jgi:hypothetical protein